MPSAPSDPATARGLRPAGPGPAGGGRPRARARRPRGGRVAGPALLAVTPVAREDVLDRIADVIDRQFGGRFTRTCVTILYAARRC